MIENAFRLQIMSTDERAHRYKISVAGIDGISLATQDEVQLHGAESRVVPVTVRIPKDKGKAGSNAVTFGLQAQDDERLQVQEKAVFFVPR